MRPLVAICMGSKSDLDCLRAAADTLLRFEVPFCMRVLSAHRTPHEMMRFASQAAGDGIEVIIAGAGGSAHLPGMLAAATLVPVVGVPVPNGPLLGIDALASIVQMPAGTPVATVGIGSAANAAFLALRMLATTRPLLRHALERDRAARAAAVAAHDREVSSAVEAAVSADGSAEDAP